MQLFSKKPEVDSLSESHPQSGGSNPPVACCGTSHAPDLLSFIMKFKFVEPTSVLVKPRRCWGFSLIEATVASAVMGLFLTVCATAIVFDQVSVRKAKEEALVMDFLTHYAENLKALPFTCLVPGFPINSLYDGANGAPNISIPPGGSWISINNTNYQIFDPDLLWLANRNPIMLVTLNSNSVSGVLEIDVNLRVDWNAPLSKGSPLEVQLDLLRTAAL
jgi:hypothetical protein